MPPRPVKIFYNEKHWSVNSWTLAVLLVEVAAQSDSLGRLQSSNAAEDPFGKRNSL